MLKPFGLALLLFVLPTAQAQRPDPPPGAADAVTLAGTVRDAEGRPLPGVTVEVVANDGVRPRTVLATAEADAAGAYALALGRLGVHVVRARRDTAGVPWEAPLLADRPGPIAADVVVGEGPNGVRLLYADPASRPARLARVLGYGGAEDASEAPATGFEAAAAIAEVSAALRARPPALDSARARAVLATVPPGDAAWVATGDLYLVLRTIAATDAPADYADYLERMVAEQPDPASVAGLAYEALGRARLAGDSAWVARTVGVLRARGLAESYWGSRALAEFGGEGPLRAGRPVPRFAFPTLDGAGVLTPEDLLGTVYLLDFWAVWCAPCVAERGDLAALYADHHARGFEIVSVSLDFDRDDVDLERWPMPWRHGFVGAEGPEFEAVRQAFALGALPKLVLVGADGRVIAGGPEIRPDVVGRLLPDVLR